MQRSSIIRIFGTMGLALSVMVGLWGALPAALAQSGDWPDIKLVEVENGFDSPVHITHAGDGSGRIFVVEQDGVIKIIKNGQTLATPFLDIKNIVRSSEDGGHNEEGLLSVAFPPDYANKQHFYVYYTNLASNLMIARYSLLSEDVADPNSEESVLTINHPGEGNHNGGQLAFGPNDGYLYLATGDGGGGGDPNENAQNLNQLLGKMLRIDVETDNPATYTIPDSNPFFGATLGRDEIWALGLRNPWRFSFDRQTGDLYIGDVGQNKIEEIDFQLSGSNGGENYGWDILEGSDCFEPSNNCTEPDNYSPPIAQHEHDIPNTDDDNCSITGGFVYRGQKYPSMQGTYFYADFCSGRIWGLKRNGVTWENTELLNTSFFITTFGEDEAGNLYLADRGGTIYEITAPAADLSLSSKEVTPAFGEPGETFTYTINIINSGDPVTETVYLTDTLPAGLMYVPDTLTAPIGTVDDSGPDLLWNGILSPTTSVQVTYQVTATGVVTGALTNQAVINSPSLDPITRTKSVLISPEQVYLPIILK